jgi:hypothetical protein
MKVVYWLPRIISILFVLFLAMFSLDVFGNGYTWWETIVGLFMHNIPAMILAVIVWISWKYEIVGGIGFILAGFAYIAMLAISGINNQFEWYMISWSMTIAGPAFLVGGLFLLNWREKRKTIGKK